MPYEPNQISPANRSRAFTVIWIGAAAFAIVAFWTAFAPDREPAGLLFGAAISAPLAAAIPTRADDYLKSLFHFALRWVGGGVTLYAFVAWIARFMIDSPDFRSVLLDGYFAALVLIGCFYLGYAVAWLRDNPLWGPDE